MANSLENCKLLLTVGQAVMKSWEVIMDTIQEEEEEIQHRTRKMLLRNRRDANIRLMAHYFDENFV